MRRKDNYHRIGSNLVNKNKLKILHLSLSNCKNRIEMEIRFKLKLNKGKNNKIIKFIFMITKSMSMSP